LIKSTAALCCLHPMMYSIFIVQKSRVASPATSVAEHIYLLEGKGRLFLGLSYQVRAT